MLRLHFVEVELRCQVHFDLKGGPSYHFNVVMTHTTLFSLSCLGIFVKVQDLSVRNNLSSDALKVIRGRSVGSRIRVLRVEGCVEG